MQEKQTKEAQQSTPPATSNPEWAEAGSGARPAEREAFAGARGSGKCEEQTTSGTPCRSRARVAAGNLPARNAPSPLGSAPLPPVAELEAAHRLCSDLVDALVALDFHDWCAALHLFNTLGERLAAARRATGGNDPSSASLRGGQAS